jgi:hypothetical protein
MGLPAAMMKFCSTMQVCPFTGEAISWNGRAFSFSGAGLSWVGRAPAIADRPFLAIDDLHGTADHGLVHWPNV